MKRTRDIKIYALARSRKGSMFLYLAALGLLIAVFAFLTIKVMEKPAQGETRYIGEHQIAIMNTATNAEKFMLFIDQASKPSVKKSAYMLAQKGGYISGSDCGQYLGYEIWLGRDKDGKLKNCLPEEDILKNEISRAVNNEIYNYLNYYWGGQNSQNTAPMTDSNMASAGSLSATQSASQMNPAPSVSGAAVMIPLPAPDKYASRLPLGMLGKMPPNNYDVLIKQEKKDQLKISYMAKEKAEFDIIVSVVKRTLAGDVGNVMDSAATMIETNFGSCNIQVPNSQSRSIGSTTSGSLKDAAQMPMDGPYANVYSDGARSRGRNYGTNDLVLGMQKWGCALKQKYNIKLAFGDMSAKEGGSAGSHASHESGRDVDLGLIFKSGSRVTMGPSNAVQGGSVSPELDLEANWFLVETILKTSDIQFIFLDQTLKDALIRWARSNNKDNGMISQAESKVRDWPNHQNHYHIRLACPKGDSQCIT